VELMKIKVWDLMRCRLVHTDVSAVRNDCIFRVKESKKCGHLERYSVVYIHI